MKHICSWITHFCLLFLSSTLNHFSCLLPKSALPISVYIIFWSLSLKAEKRWLFPFPLAWTPVSCQVVCGFLLHPIFQKHPSAFPLPLRKWETYICHVATVVSSASIPKSLPSPSWPLPAESLWSVLQHTVLSSVVLQWLQHDLSNDLHIQDHHNCLISSRKVKLLFWKEEGLFRTENFNVRGVWILSTVCMFV